MAMDKDNNDMFDMRKNDMQNDMMSDAGKSFGRRQFSLYQKRKKSTALPVIIGVAAFVGAGLYTFSDKIPLMTNDNPVITVAEISDKNSGSEGSFTDINPAAGEQVAVGQAEKIAAETAVETPVAENMPSADTAVAGSEQSDTVEEKKEDTVNKQDLVAKILEESAQNVKKKTTLDATAINGGKPNPELEEIITGKKSDTSLYDAGKAFDKSQSTADIIRESVVVRPQVKKIVIVDKVFASSSDRALAEAAIRAMNEKQYSAAYDLYSEILKKDPSNVTAKSGTAKALVYMGRKEEAMAVYQEIMNRNPGNKEVISNYFSLVGESDPASAVAELEQLADKNPRSAEIQGQIGIIYGKMKDPIRAVKAFEKASLLDPSNPVYTYNTAVLADRMDNRTKAADYYERTLASMKSSSAKTSLSAEKIENRLSELYSRQ